MKSKAIQTINLKEIKTMENVNTENLELNAWLVLYNEAIKRANSAANFSDKEYWILMAVGYSKTIGEIK